jgi:anaphase-promoting complex subunit 2
VKLDFDDGNERVFTVTPFQATVISYFADRDSWTVNALASQLGVEAQALQRRSFLWVNQGVLLESRRGSDVVYTTAKTIDNGDGDTSFAPLRDDGAGFGLSSATDGDIQDEIMQVYESYITGMLTNFEALPLDRIHNMLKMFVSTGEHKYDKRVEELAAFLNRLVDQEKLECSGDGVYRLRK